MNELSKVPNYRGQCKTFYVIIGLLILITTSCTYNVSIKKRMITRTPEQVVTPTKSQQEKTNSQDEKDEELKVIDFFGVKMQGKYDDIVNNIYTLPMLSLVERRDTIMKERKGVMSFSHTVEFCGIPCGMNVRCRMKAANEMSINDLCFITSQTDDEIIHKFVSELTKYYGEPDISDEQENSYHWYLSSGLAVRARHLHTPDGGWTVYFCY